MPFYRSQGILPAKKHTTFYRADGKTLHREELYSTRGFSGAYSTRYRLRMPTRVTKIAEERLPAEPAWDDVPLQWHLFHTARSKRAGDFFHARTRYLHNEDLAIYAATPDAAAPFFYKNAYAHELVFVHRGAGKVRTEFGDLAFGPGDYLVLPKGVLYAMEFEDHADNRLLVVESGEPIDVPAHYRSDTGQFLEHSPYCERDLRAPALGAPIDERGEFEVRVKAGDRVSIQTWDHHPLDVVGWDGCEYPYAFNIRDFSAKVGQLHLPPPVHLVFASARFVVCNFVPRPLDFHPQAIPAPYFHTNVDSDEVIYYVDGEFTSRKGIEAGSITLHPTGLPHGPQPGRTEASVGKKSAEEYAVMIDTFRPLRIAKAVQALSDPDYSRSWLGEDA